MGLFDLPAPLLAWIDAALAAAGLPPAVRLLVWAALASALAMALYRLLASQERLADLKARIAATRRAIVAHDGDFAGLRPLLGRSIALSLRHVGLALVPSVVASLPVLAIAAWLAGAYAYALPEAGDRVDVRITPATAATHWRPADAQAGPSRIEWPASSLDLVDARGARLLSLPLEHAVPVVHHRLWWNGLFGNPLGYLPAATAVRRIEIDLPQRRYLHVGPAWLDRWETVYFAAVLVMSLLIKVTFRIH